MNFESDLAFSFVTVFHINLSFLVYMIMMGDNVLSMPSDSMREAVDCGGIFGRESEI